MKGISQQTRAATHRLNPDIQVLRAIAIIMVLIEHIQLNLFYWRSSLEDFLDHYWRGAPGVDLFFVISGYVIGRSLLPRLNAASGGAAYLAETLTFLLRRFWRLQPAAWLWIALPLLLTGLFNKSGAFHTYDGNLPAALTALLAIHNLRDMLLPAVGATPQIFFPYWSLSLEEQFYLLLPIALFVFRKRFATVLLLSAAYQFVAPWSLMAIYTRPGALACGVLLALWQTSPAYQVAEPRFLARNHALRLAFLVSIVVLLGATLSQPLAPLHSVRYGLQEVLAATLVYTASFDRGYILSDGRLRRFLEWIGARSYALYLVHAPAYALARELIWRVHRPTFVHDTLEAAAHLILGLALTTLLAHVTYMYVEAPLRLRWRDYRVGVPMPQQAIT